MIKSRRMRCAGHVACMGETESERIGVYRVWWVHLREGDHLGDPGIDVRIIIRWIFRKWYVGGMALIDLAQDTDRFGPL